MPLLILSNTHTVLERLHNDLSMSHTHDKRSDSRLLHTLFLFSFWPTVLSIGVGCPIRVFFVVFFVLVVFVIVFITLLLPPSCRSTSDFSMMNQSINKIFQPLTRGHRIPSSSYIFSELLFCFNQ